MQQVHLLFYGSGSNVSAQKKDPSITRSIVECQLIDEYHWLPQDIKKISYKMLQTLLLFKKQKNEINQTKINVSKFKNQNQGSRSSG